MVGVIFCRTRVSEPQVEKIRAERQLSPIQAMNNNKERRAERVRLAIHFRRLTLPRSWAQERGRGTAQRTVPTMVVPAN